MGLASPARDATAAIFTVSFCASPRISDSKSLFEEPNQKRIESAQSITNLYLGAAG